MKKKYLIIKESIDLLASLIFITISLPILLLIAFLIKFSSSGPILFKHKRIGKNKKPFYCFKFRTMHTEADDLLKNLLDNDENFKNEFDKNHKLKNDPRITYIGKFLRKTSLDELPQLFNVLKNEMSIVGPRPIVKSEMKKYGKAYNSVNSVKPGITGLWQVSGRNNLSYKRRVDLDLIYVKNINFIMDLRIIIRTLGVIIFPKDRGAY